MLVQGKELLSDEDTEIISHESPDKPTKKKAAAAVIEPVFTVEILKLVKDSQQQHGLRHSDYQRYRGYCSRRIRRLRKGLHLPSSDRHNFKKKIYIDEQKVDDKTIAIPLMLTERAWSYAMQLRLEANTETRKKFHLVSRLRKATKYALQLQNLCESPKFDSRTKLEAEGYVAWMYGTLHFELQLWDSAIEYFKKAQMIYEKLANALNEVDAPLYRQKSEEILPSLRYCAYNLGLATATELLQLRSQTHGELLKNLDILVAQTVTHSENAMNEVKWRNRSFAVKSKNVRGFLLADRDLEQSFINGSTLDNINLLEQHLMDCKDAIAIVKDECKVEPSNKGIGPLGENVSSAQLLLHYLSYIRLNRTIQRNRLMIDVGKRDMESKWTADDLKKMDTNLIQLIKSQNFTRLYEIIIQNLVEMEQLPISEYDKEFVDEVRIRMNAYQALRYHSIAENFTNVGKWSDAVKLYENAAKLAEVALQHDFIEPVVIDELRTLLRKIESSRMIIKAKSMLEPESYQSKNKMLIDRLDEYFEDTSLLSSDPKIVEVPPPMLAIPCKPLFFDLALDMVKFPALDDKIKKKDTSTAENSSGLRGLVKGLWGWNKESK